VTKILTPPPPFIEIREVTHQDKWCRISRRKSLDTTEEAPFGHILVMLTPKVNVKLEILKNYVVLRTNEKKGKFYLQVHLTQYQIRRYGIDNKAIEFEGKKKKGKKVKRLRRHILNMRNFNKIQNP